MKFVRELLHTADNFDQLSRLIHDPLLERRYLDQAETYRVLADNRVKRLFAEGRIENVA